MVYVTHDQTEALTLSDIVVVMNKGLVMQSGTPYDIYHHTYNIFVDEFIGDPQNNFFKGQIVEKDGQLQLDCQGIVFPMKNQPSSDSRKVIATVRPENINVSFHEQKDWLKVTLKSVQPTGANTILQVKHGNTGITLLQPEFIRMKLDEPLWVSFDPESLNFFDEETGKSLHL